MRGIGAFLTALVTACGSPSPRPATGAHTPQPAPVAAPPKPTTAPEIVKAMTARYAKVATYIDHGIVTSGGTGGQTATRTFETAFIRTSRFRFALRDENDPQRGYVLWADPTHTYSRWFAPARMTDDGPALKVAVAVAQKPTLGVLPTLAYLLRPDAVPGTELAEPTLAGTEMIDDRLCWMIAGKRGDVATKLWIDQASLELRKTSEIQGDATHVAIFRPTLDPPLLAEQVIAPDFSDEYESGSPLLAKVRTMVTKGAPAFDAAVISGSGPANIAGLAGQVVLIDFWATWCGPCRQTLPRLNEWHRKLGPRGLRIIGLSSEDTDDVQEFMKTTKLDYTIGHDKNGKIARTYNAAALPMLVIVDRTGIVRFVTFGAGELDYIEAVLEGLLK